MFLLVGYQNKEQYMNNPFYFILDIVFTFVSFSDTFVSQIGNSFFQSTSGILFLKTTHVWKIGYRHSLKSQKHPLLDTDYEIYFHFIMNLKTSTKVQLKCISVRFEEEIFTKDNKKKEN